jgi:hypothetical protein
VLVLAVAEAVVLVVEEVVEELVAEAVEVVDATVPAQTYTLPC